jgi:mycothiol synthase
MSIRALAPPEFTEARPTIARLDDAVRDARSIPALGESVWRDLEQPGPDSAGFFDGDRAFLHIARSDNFSPQHWALGLAVAPGVAEADVVGPLVEAAAAHARARGGGRLVLWRFGVHEGDDAPYLTAGFRISRDLYEMRVALPLEEQPKWADGITVRTFEPGRDDAEWLAVNNRAFANHPEQGGWIESTLQRRMADAWFDPSIFVLAFDDDGLAGYNWGKIHQGHGRDPDMGEIFVIGVDPRAAGRGLGRALAIEGLSRMAARGVGTGVLFTDAANERAVRLYRSLGFDVHRVDRAYELDVPDA